MRLSSSSQAGVTCILLHDSIGVGEDRPTHQPVEESARLRTIPGMNLLRPTDANEVEGGYEIATSRGCVPTIMFVA